MKTPATAGTAPGLDPTTKESNMTERIAPRCECRTEGKIVRGMCVKHYDRWVQATPKDQRPPAPRTIRRFWDHVDKSGDCWQWTGPVNAKGYGVWSQPGFKGLAHRYSLMQVIEPFAGAFACHHCDNPSCVIPEHLYWGTERDNSRDCRLRGRTKNQNTAKTHCKNGHELAGDNLRLVGKDRRRQCRICDNERSRIKMAARRAREADNA